MSKSTTMLRTRRKDNNVKPNRRLDRKSSRGMLYENEELRLKTININAEVERGQSDIKKLKRENDQLRREIWYLRDEYDKLDKLLREKENQGSSSSSSCTSDSESCSSCTEESEAVETSQNIENVQKTTLKKLTQEFDHLSVVPEENSAENSEKNSNSNRASLPENSNTMLEKDVIKPDQSYPAYDNITKANTLPLQEKTPKHFFSPIKISKPSDDYVNNQFLGPDTSYMGQTFNQPNECFDNLAQATPCGTRGFVPQVNFYPSLALPPLHKTTTDVIVKTDNQNFNTLRSQSSFSNGGNLEELLNDIETISHDILKMSNSQNQGFQSPSLLQFGHQNVSTPFPSFNGETFNENASDIVAQIQNTNASYLPSPRVDNYDVRDGNESDNRIPLERPYKSELNVVLMPSPMQLIEIDKYKTIQKSCENSVENLSTSCQNLKIIPETASPNVIISPEHLYTANGHSSQTPPNLLEPYQPFVPVPPVCPAPDGRVFTENLQQQNLINEQTTNPFFFGNIRQHPSETTDFFNARYIPENFAVKEAETTWISDNSKLYKTSQRKDPEIYNSKTNLLDTAVSSDHISSENEENLKFKTSRNDKDSKSVEKSNEKDKETKKHDSKSPKLNIRRKVSIHFKGKKDKSKSKETAKTDEKPKTPIQEKKHSFFDLKFSSDKKGLHQKTPSIESKLSTVALEPKTPNSGDSKTSTSDNKNSKTDSKNFESSSISDQKNATSDAKTLDKKNRKSSSASPERKHGHKEGKKCHRKHKKGERARHRRPSTSADRFHRERSYSVCTDRSNILDHRLGLYNMYDDFGTTSERERTNSLSSCDTMKGRKLSNISHFPNTGKIPWCGCWGNGCL